VILLRLGFGTSSLSDMTLADIVRWAGLNGFRCLEVAGVLTSAVDDTDHAAAPAAGFSGPRLEIESLDEQAAADLKSLLAEAGVSLSSIAYFPNLLHPALGPASRECALRAIDAAAMLGCNWTTHLGRDVRLDVWDNLDLVEKVWPDIIEYARKRSVSIAVHNCPHPDTEFDWPTGLSIPTNPAIWRRIFEICPQANFGLSLDTWHFIYQRIDPERTINSIGERIISVRATDGHWNQAIANEIGTVAVRPHLLVQQCVVGTGDLNLGNLFGALWRVGFNGDVFIEYQEHADAIRAPDRARKALLLGKRLIDPYLT
jgi:sugar phosphate isomerase/epimerase